MDYSLVTSVDPASNEMMATKEIKSDSKPGNNVDATMNDEEKIIDKEMKFEDNEKVIKEMCTCKSSNSINFNKRVLTIFSFKFNSIFKQTY